MHKKSKEIYFNVQNTKLVDPNSKKDKIVSLHKNKITIEKNDIPIRKMTKN